jgi:dihydroorotase
MANTSPVNDNGAVTDYILAKAKVEGLVRVYPIGAVTRNLRGEELAELAELAESGCVAFSDDGKCVMNAGLYRRAMEYTLPFGAPIISHAEDSNLSAGASINEGVVSTELGLPGQPAAAEDVMVARDILLAELTGAHVHIAHASTAGTVRLVRDAKARGIRVTAEVTPHHLILTEDAVRSWDANNKMAPPLRTKRDVEALIEGLADETIDCIATDHAPHALSEKEGEYDHAAFGIVGLETAVAVVLDRLVRAGHLPLATLIARWSRDPAPPQPARRNPLGRRAGRRDRPRPRRGNDRGSVAVSFTSRNTPFGGWLREAVDDGRRRHDHASGEEMKAAWLVLRDGRTFRGRSLGAVGEAAGEVIFNTAMQGYQEILTDPSYRGQIVAMTYPMIGNYGVNEEDVESRRPWVNGFIVKEASQVASNFRSGASLDAYLARNGIVGIQAIDTRALTRHLRDRGAQDGIISSVETDPARLLGARAALPASSAAIWWPRSPPTPPTRGPRAPGSCRADTGAAAGAFRVVAYDCGIKFNILRQLRTIGCDVTVVPASTTTAQVLDLKPDGVFISNGPVIPRACPI